MPSPPGHRWQARGRRQSTPSRSCGRTHTGQSQRAALLLLLPLLLPPLALGGCQSGGRPVLLRGQPASPHSHSPGGDTCR